MASTTEQYALPTLSLHDSNSGGPSSTESSTSLNSAALDASISIGDTPLATPPAACDTQLRPQLSLLTNMVLTPHYHSDIDLEAQIRPLTRAKTLAVPYPVRELGGCCRTTLRLHFEFAVYTEAIEADAQKLPFMRTKDLNAAISNLSGILKEFEKAGYQGRWTGFWEQQSKIQEERKLYIHQLKDDLAHIKLQLEKRHVAFSKLGEAINSTLSSESIQRLNFDGLAEMPLHLDDSTIASLTAKPCAPAEQIDLEPIKRVKQVWKQALMREEFRTNTGFQFLKKDDLSELWNKCVVGTPVVLEEEVKPFRLSLADVERTYGNSRLRQISPASLINRPQWTALPPIYSPYHNRRNGGAKLIRLLKKPPRSEPVSISRFPDIFVVVGWFSGPLHEPVETCVHVREAGRFLPEMKRQIRAARGWRTVFSFKTVTGFSLYKCHPIDGGHSIYEASQETKVALSQLYGAIESSSPDKYTTQDSRDWAEWVYHTFNDSQKYPYRSELSLQLIIKWSQLRILAAATLPLILSFAVGIYYMSMHEGVESTSAAWTIASYIATAGAFIIALLAVLSSLKDG